METETLNPTWEAAVEIYMAAIEHGSGAGKEAAKAEIRRLARAFDTVATGQSLAQTEVISTGGTDQC